MWHQRSVRFMYLPLQSSEINMIIMCQPSPRLTSAGATMHVLR